MSAFDLINLFYFSTIILFGYSTYKFSLKNSSIEFVIAFIFALGFESFNILNGHYSYPFSYSYIGKVPISIILAWYSIFMLGKFWILSILSFITHENEKYDYLIPISPVLIGLVAATFVYMIDPLATKLRWWEWYPPEPTPFLGVPIGELLGIFISTTMISVLYFLINILLNRKLDLPFSKMIQAKFNKLDFIPILLYEFMLFILATWSILESSNDSDPLIGVLVTLLACHIIVFIWFLLFIINLKEYFSLEHINKFGLIFSFILIILGAILFVVGSIAIFFNNFGLFVSFHMLTIAISLCILAIGSSLYLRIKS